MGKRVAIIGAGPSGLPSIRHALLHGFEPVCFEATSDIGGLWNYKPQHSDEASVMKSTIINSSKEMTAYSDFPPKKEFANFMHNTSLLQYFREYAEHFDLLKHIRFNHRVSNVRRSDTFESDGTWTVEYEHGGHPTSEQFAMVLVCTGHHKTPHVPPKWAGQEDFKGTVIHSHDYKTPSGFEDKRVVCLGVGNSGLDIAVELSRVAKQVYLSTRRGAWIFNRISTNGIPIDLVLGSRFRRGFLDLLPTSMRSKSIENMCNSRFDHEVYGLKPDFGPFSSHISINDDLPNRIASGTIKVKGDIAGFSANGIKFRDGSEESVDAVVLSTGYRITFPMLEQGNLVEVKDNWVRLYKHMFVPGMAHNTLAVIGLIQPLGSIMPISEMQARLFFAAQSGQVALPGEQGMLADIQRMEEAVRRRFIASPRHTIQVDYTPYMDELAEMVGCRPDYSLLLKTDPVLAFYSFTLPNASYNYRLMGPHKWSGARDAVLQISDRTGFRHVENKETLYTLLKYFFILLVVVLIFV